MKKYRDKPMVQITHSNIEEYAGEMTTPESPETRELVESSKQALEYVDMLSGNMVGQLLKMLIKISGATRVLEIGTFTGYSALTMAEALPLGGELITIEMNLRYQELAEKHFKKFDKDEKIKLLKGDARELIGGLEGKFDLVFLDADKISYPFYFQKLLPKLKPAGLLAADNVLWSGTVLDPEDEKAKALHNFNQLIADEKGVEQVLLPVRDGITILRKK